jgi:hypothetical protein
MGLSTSDPQSAANGTPEAGRELPEVHTRVLGDRPQAVADLLRNKLLTQSFGFQGEWEVRTTLTTSRQAWRYRSSVLLHGKEMGDSYAPIDVDWTHKIRQAKAVTEEMLVEFAEEAVELHFLRCADVADYSLMASIYAQSPPRYRWMTKAALVLSCVAALSAAYWFWWGPTAWTRYSHIENPRLAACSGRHSRCLTASQRENHLSCLCPPWNTLPTGGPSKSRSRDWVTSLTGSVSIVNGYASTGPRPSWPRIGPIGSSFAPRPSREATVDCSSC